MITPAFGLTATERVLPRLALDFTTASLDPRITFTRTTGASNPATYIDSSGVITAAMNNQPRFDYDPVTLVCKGLLIEESRTNSLLNSDTLSTQSVTVTAAARTLSFYGTGQVVLSGAHSATVTGTGAYPTRTTLTFTPSAGTLTLTVTGTVQYAQLEAGAFATSYIPTTLLPLTRNADIAMMTGTNFSDWYSSTAGTFLAQYWTEFSGNFDTTRYMLNGDGSGSKRIISHGGGLQTASTYDGTTGIFTLGDVTGQSVKVVSAYDGSGRAIAAAGTATQTGTVAAGYSTMSTLNIGSNGTGSFLCGWVQQLQFWPQRLTNNEIQAFSK